MTHTPLSDEPLPFGKITLGTRQYREFACSKSTASWLMAGGMTHIDGRKVTLQVVDDFGPNVMINWRPIEKDTE